MKLIKNIFSFLLKALDKAYLLLFILFLVFIFKIRLPIPDVNTSITPSSYVRETVGENHYRIGESWLKKNDFGVWEMYLEGSPYERGVKYGVLAKEIIESQEESFVNQLNELIPSQFFQKFLTGFIAWMNRDMDDYISDENLQEIYGISLSFSDKYDYVGPKFYRILYYHAAHDIGHALADLRIVGCTSFSVKDEFSEDGELLIGRNFDFYMGDDFAKDKLVMFVKPDSGYGFSSYSWAGLTGVVSGMNEHGLTVTLNAAKSDIPTKAKEPISLLAREILQYAKTIDEAIKIAENKSTFVSESLLIGSAIDRKSVIIEKSPSKMDVFDDGMAITVCANHYQSEVFKNEDANIENIKMSDSKFRFDRMNELIKEQKPLNYLKSAAILRDKCGIGAENIGLGNPQSINQLIAYHSVIFKPESRQMWLSTYPLQLGDYICYDLDEVFRSNGHFLVVDSLTIPEDDFVNSNDYLNFVDYKKQKEKITKHVMFGSELELSSDEINKFIGQNPNSYETYFSIGRYYESSKKYCEAIEMYKLALTKKVASKAEEISIQKSISDLNALCNN